MKLLKQVLPNNVHLTLINESPNSYYSGMLPGLVATLYTAPDVTVQMLPLAKWCKADYIEKKVKRVIAKDNKIELEDGQLVEYDLLSLNVGSRTRGTFTVKGVWDNALTTRPINLLLPKIEKLENELLANKVIPNVAVCGAGAAGIELSFGFKQRWT